MDKALGRTGVRLLVPALALLLGGCSLDVLNPQGLIGIGEKQLILTATWAMLIVVVPVILLTLIFAWRYRASNRKARYERDWESTAVDTVTWIVPALIVTSLGVHVSIYTHALDPYKPLQSSDRPLEIQVVAQDWKWLFIYPAQGVATVNEIAFPSDVPISLKITSDTVMNSFFIPALAGQIYAMAGMQTQLNLRASNPGRFVGRNTQYSGRGFADQHFVARAMTPADFDAWLARVAQSPSKLDVATYAELVKPSAAHPVAYYSSVEAGLFDGIIQKYGKLLKRESPAAKQASR
jgi:cytochrome o ubiquinol oxidase subunit 2